jgi:ABC-2 type transport system ATP-binding protein
MKEQTLVPTWLRSVHNDGAAEAQAEARSTPIELAETIITGDDDAMEAIAVEGLTKTYHKKVQALAGISFTVHEGEIFGLLGPNGAGKTTAVRILATLTQADGGRAFVAGHDVRREPDAVRHEIGYVAQASGVDKYATGRENLVLQAQLQRVPRAEIPGRVSRVLERVGLSDAANRIVNTYSGGMKRRLDIAMGLVHEPTVLFLDEPTTGLDPETRAALWEDLERLRHEHKLAVLLTTHYLEEADHLCDRLAIVDHGRIVVQGTPSELKAQIQGDLVALSVDGAARRAADLLRPIQGVLEILTDGGEEVVARVDHGATAVPVLINLLEREGVDVHAVTLSRPSLDEVYLYHTGHRFEAGGNENGTHPER